MGVGVSEGPRVLLVGLMGSGKSTVGTTLAGALGAPYLDNDALLAEQTGLGLLELAERGRAELHAAESRQLRALSSVPGPWVAGAAASTADRPEDCSFASEHFFVAYLHVAPDVLAVRLSGDGERPWLADDALATISDMYRRRDAAFRAAAHVVVEAARSPADSADTIREALAR